MLDSIGQRIKGKRKELGLTQEKLAKLCGNYTSDISDWEKNKTKPSLDKVSILAINLKTTTDFLIQGAITNKEEGGQKMDCVIKLEMLMESPYLQKNEKAELLGYIQMFYEKEKTEREKDARKKIQTIGIHKGEKS